MASFFLLLVYWLGNHQRKDDERHKLQCLHRMLRSSQVSARKGERPYVPSSSCTIIIVTLSYTIVFIKWMLASTQTWAQ